MTRTMTWTCYTCRAWSQTRLRCRPRLAMVASMVAAPVAMLEATLPHADSELELGQTRLTVQALTALTALVSAQSDAGVTAWTGGRLMATRQQRPWNDRPGHSTT